MPRDWDRNDNRFGRMVGGFLFAVVLGALAFWVGRIGASQLCDGSCQFLSATNERLSGPFVWKGEQITWALALSGLIGVPLWLALSKHEGRTFPAVIMLGVITLLGAHMVGNNVPQAPDEPIIAEPIIVPEPAEEIIQISETITKIPNPDCPDGQFWNGEGCLSCLVTRDVPASARAYFAPMSMDAAWSYAEHLTVDRAGRVSTLSDLSIAASICEADAVLVIGAASSDGPLARNLSRAKRRANQLSSRVANACPEVPIFALSFGQSVAKEDKAIDRALTIIAVQAAPGEIITDGLILAELGHAMNNDTMRGDLMTRRASFPQTNWSWVNVPGAQTPEAAKSDPASIAITPRGFIRQDYLRDDAGDTCLPPA